MNYKGLWVILCETFRAWSDREAPRLGAALAFYSLLSIAPLLVLTLAMTAAMFGHTNAQDQIVNQVQRIAGEAGATAVRSLMESAQKPSSGIIASISGIVALLFGAAGVFGELRSALNKVWEVKPNAQAGIWSMLRERFFSFGMVLAVGFLLLISLVISASLAAFENFFSNLFPLPALVASGIDLAISLAATAFLFALIFKYLPETPTKIALKDVCGGALATAVFFTLGKYLIGLYLGKAAIGSAYGAAGSLVMMIVWIYYSAMIFLFGAELTHVLQCRKIQAGHSAED